MEGYWLNPQNDKYIEVMEHSSDIGEEKVLRRLGMNPNRFLPKIEGLSPYGDRMKILMAALKSGLIRVRRHGHSTTFEFYSSRNMENILMGIYMFLRKTNIEGSIQVNNIKSKDFASFSFTDLKEAIGEGEVETLVRVGKIARNMVKLAKGLLELDD